MTAAAGASDAIITYTLPTASASLDMSSLRFTVEDTDATDGLDASFRMAGEPPLYTVAYRPLRREQVDQIEADAPAEEDAETGSTEEEQFH